ncbi:hypothetical protein Thermus77420_23730 [Thermus thalpophilus]
MERRRSAARWLPFLFLLLSLSPALAEPLTLLGVDLGGRSAGAFQEFQLQQSFMSLANLVNFSCDPRSVELQLLPRPFTERERKAAEARLLEAGWAVVEKDSLPPTHFWVLRQRLLGRETHTLLVESLVKGQAFLGACRLW